tara:strand:- start:736 stop:1275 length:540 start_codon:yes stop_codon:yes gene_type:complete
MDPATIALSIAACKKVLDSAKDVQSIGHALDDLWSAEEAHKARKTPKKQPTTRMQQVLKIRAGDEGYDDDTAISAVANDVLAQKQNERAMKGLAREIDRKWGYGTWDTILEERNKRLKEKKVKDKEHKEKIEERKKHDKEVWDKIYYWSKEFGKLMIIVLFAGLGIWWLIENRCIGAVC